MEKLKANILSISPYLDSSGKKHDKTSVAFCHGIPSVPFFPHKGTTKQIQHYLGISEKSTGDMLKKGNGLKWLPATEETLPKPCSLVNAIMDFLPLPYTSSQFSHCSVSSSQLSHASSYIRKKTTVMQASRMIA